MNLLFITNVFPSPLEPTKGIFNLHLVRGMSQRHRVSVIAPISWREEARAAWQRDVSFDRSRETVFDGIEVCYPRFIYPPGILREHYGWFFWRSIKGTVQRLASSMHLDAVFSYWAHPDGEAAVRVARLAGVPSTVIVGGSDVLLITRQRRRRRRVLDVLRATDVVVTVNQHLRKTIVDFGVRPDQVHVWHQGIDRTLFRPEDPFAARRKLGIPTERQVLVWVGRMVPVKGLDVLLKSCAVLHAQAIDFHLYLVGDGPLMQTLIRESKDRGLSTSVTFVGSKLHDELPDWYRAADLTVLPSRSEGLPNVLRESLACGTPFVASDVGGVSEIGDDTCRILVPSENSEALVKAIQRGLSRWGSVRRPESAPRFLTWEESAESLLEILKMSKSSSSVTVISTKVLHHG